jgi:predicted negative regulator of RcsB-dependent stress response
MNKLAIFLDKNYFYIITFLVLIAIAGSTFVLRNKNNTELIKKIGDQYLNIITSNPKGDFNNDQIENLKKISVEKNNFASLSSLLLTNYLYKKNDFANGDENLLKLINNKEKNKMLRDYALYSYAHSLLERNDMQKLAELLPKLNDKSQIFHKNSIELMAIYYINQKDYKNAVKIIDDNIKSIHHIETLKSRLDDIKNEAQNFLS